MRNSAPVWLCAAGLLSALGVGVGQTVAAAPTNQAVEAALTCQCGCGLTVHNCNHLQCGFAIPAKEQIAEHLNQGLSYDTILASFVERYGEKVLSAPTASGFNLTAWAMPFLVVVAGAAGIVLIARRWTRRRPQTSTQPPVRPSPASNAYADRLKRELDNFER